MIGEVLQNIINIISPIATIILSITVFVRTIKVDRKKEHLEAPSLIIYNFSSESFIENFKEKIYKPQAIYWMDLKYGPFSDLETHSLFFQRISAGECIEKLNNYILCTGILLQNYSTSPLYIDSFIGIDNKKERINHPSVCCLEKDERIFIFCKQSLQPKRLSGMLHGTRIYYELQYDEPISIIIPKNNNSLGHDVRAERRTL